MNTLQTEAFHAAYIYSTVKQLCEQYPAFTEGGIRALIFNEDKNGLAESGAIVRIGRKLLIHTPKFFTWVEAQQKRGVK